MLKDGGDKEHAVDLDTIVAGVLQSVIFFRISFGDDNYLERLGQLYSQVITICCVCNTPFELLARIQATRPLDLQYFSNQELATEALAAPARSNSGSKSWWCIEEK